MEKGPSFFKNLTFFSACLLGALCLIGSLVWQRAMDGGLMSSFYVTVLSLPDLGSIKAWENEEEELYYVFLPSACSSGEEMLEIRTPFPEFQLSLAEITEDISEGFSYEPDKRYTLKWKLFNRFTVKECSVMFVNSENIPALMLETENGRSFALDTQIRETYREVCRIKIVDENGETCHALEKAEVSGRGNSTWEAAKKPIKFKLTEEEGLLGMAPALRYNLIANAFDGSHMRNKIMLDMANEISEDFAADGTWVELYYNGEYEGLYLLTEKVEIAESRLNIPSLEEENEKVNGKSTSKYKDFGFEEEYQGMTIKGVELPDTPEDITGGYLLEMDLSIRYKDAASGFITGEGQIFTLESPEYADRSEVQYIADIAADVESALYSEDGISKISGKRLEELIDITSFADAYLYGEISGEQDTGISSQYIYKKPDSESTLLYAGSVWDFDGSMGNTNPEMYAYPECLCVSEEEVRGSATGISNKWFSALCRHQVFTDKVAERYEEIFYDKTKEVILEKLKEYGKVIRKAAVRDRLRWHYDSGNWPFIWPSGYAVEREDVLIEGYYAYDKLDSQIGQITEFLTRKTDFLYDLWVNQSVYHKVYIKPQAEFLSDTMFYGRYYMVKEGECIPEPPYYTSEWYQGENYERKGFYLAGTEEEVDITAPVYEDMDIIDIWEKHK